MANISHFCQTLIRVASTIVPCILNKNARTMGARIVGKLPKPTYISLKKIGKTHGETSRFGTALLEGLGDAIFGYRSMTDLLYDVLSQVSPTYKTLEKTDASIETECAKILRHFGFGKEATLYRLTDTGKEKVETKRKPRTATSDFREDILYLGELPGPILQRLSREVETDLREISALIRRYESEPFIQQYLQFDDIPTSQKERMTFDFYKRCVKERGEIINYQLDGLKPRALQKARRVGSLFFNILSLTDAFHDRPYDFARRFAIHRFDSEQIDLASHRVGEFPMRESIRLEKLYASDKAKFYRIYFRHITPAQHFENLMYYLPYLPMRNDRKPIFEELIRLFKAKRWMSFYALALPQVEGLFSEMCEIALPKKDFSRRALPFKVESLRPFHSGSYSYFDYYQYYIPLQRNKFAHTGYDDDFKMKSYDLISDLVHLLSIFYELDNPLVKVRKLHTRRNPEDFMAIADVSGYFSLLLQLSPEHKRSIATEIDDFESSFLWQSCDLAYTCQGVIEEYPGLAEQYADELTQQSRWLPDGIAFDMLKTAEINAWDHNSPILEAFMDHFHMHENARKLEAFVNFLTSYKPLLKHIPKETKAVLDALVKDRSLEIHVLKTLFDKFRSREASS